MRSILYFFEVCSQCGGGVVQRLTLQHWVRIRLPDAGKPTLSGALALLFDRAAALFGTKAAAAERHRATMRRCIVEIGQPVTAISV